MLLRIEQIVITVLSKCVPMVALNCESGIKSIFFSLLGGVLRSNRLMVRL